MIQTFNGPILEGCTVLPSRLDAYKFSLANWRLARWVDGDRYRYCMRFTDGVKEVKPLEDGDFEIVEPA